MKTIDEDAIWTIRIQKHLQEYVDSSVLSFFDSTINAGLCGRLMSRMRKTEVLSFEKLKIISADLGIMPSQLKNTIIPILEKNGIEVFRDGSGAIFRVEEDIVSYDSILPIVTELGIRQEQLKLKMSLLNRKRFVPNFYLRNKN